MTQTSRIEPPSLPFPLQRLALSEQILLSSKCPGPLSLPVPNATKSYWMSDNPLANEGRDGPLTTDADICIIGSGISGVSVAYHLSQMARLSNPPRPLKVVILDAREFCTGATGRNGGHLSGASFLNFAHLAQKYGEKEAKKVGLLEQYNIDFLFDLCKEHKWSDDIDLVDGGMNILLFSQAEKEQALIDFDASKKAGIDLSHIEWLTAQETLSRFGANFESIRVPSRNLWPLKLVTRLYELTRSSPSAAKHSRDRFSIHLHTHTPAQSVYPSGIKSSPWKVNTARGAMNCSYVVHATNAYASHLLPHLQGPTGIVPTRGQVIATRSQATEKDITSTAWSANEGFEYWFSRIDGGSYPLTILGGGREIPSKHELYNTDDSSINAEISTGLRSFLPKILPGKYKKGKDAAMEWTGIMGFTALGDPIVGPVVDTNSPGGESYKGQYISAGFSGHGMPRATACAEAVASMIMLDISSGGASKWSPPPWMPYHYLTYC